MSVVTCSECLRHDVPEDEARLVPLWDGGPSVYVCDVCKDAERCICCRGVGHMLKGDGDRATCMNCGAVRTADSWTWSKALFEALDAKRKEACGSREPCAVCDRHGHCIRAGTCLGPYGGGIL